MSRNADSDTALFEAARAVRGNAHAPYSDFAVGAAVRGASGKIYTGCNVENAAYPEGLCAEAAAIAAMVAAGEKQIAAVCVVGEGHNLVTPCGGCRQKIREFAGPQVPVLVGNESGIVQVFDLVSLLPVSFGPQNVEAKR